MHVMIVYSYLKNSIIILLKKTIKLNDINLIKEINIASSSLGSL